MQLNEEEAIQLTMQYGFDGHELESPERIRYGYLYHRQDSFIKKLNFIFDHVEVKGDKKDRTYNLKGGTKPVDEKQAIDITFEHGYNGRELTTARWIEKGYLMARDSDRLIKKLKTIYNTVELFGRTTGRRYMLKDKKDSIKIDDSLNVKKKPTKKTVNKPKVKKVKKEVVSLEEQKIIDDAKKQFLSNYFTYRVKSYENYNKKNKAFTDVIFDPATEKSRKFVWALYREHKYAFNGDRNEYLAIIIQMVAEAVEGFKPKYKDFDWQCLNTVDAKEFLILHKYIIGFIKTGIKEEIHKARGNIKTSRRFTVNGKPKTQTVFINKKTNSTDISVGVDEEDEIPRINVIASDDKLGTQFKGYYPDNFLKWFNDKKHEILTSQQLEFLDVLAPYYKEEGSNYVPELRSDPTQPFNIDNRDNRIIRLRNKVNDLYAKDNFKFKTRLQMKKEADLQLLNELIQIYEDYTGDDIDIEALRVDISDWIHEQLYNIKNTILSDLLHDELILSHLIHTNIALKNGYTIRVETINKIVDLVKRKLEQLKNFDTSVLDERLISNSGMTPERQQERMKGINDFKYNNLAKVYDFKTGKLIRTEKVDKEKRNYIVQTLDTYGNRLQEDEELETVNN